MLKNGVMTFNAIYRRLHIDEEDLEAVLKELQGDGIIETDEVVYWLKG